MHPALTPMTPQASETPCSIMVSLQPPQSSATQSLHPSAFLFVRRVPCQRKKRIEMQVAPPIVAADHTAELEGAQTNHQGCSQLVRLADVPAGKSATSPELEKVDNTALNAAGASRYSQWFASMK